jgi:hypothetical protein
LMSATLPLSSALTGVQPIELAMRTRAAEASSSLTVPKICERRKRHQRVLGDRD